MNENSPLEEACPDACLHCNSPDYEPGYKVRLCKKCRKCYSRYPIKASIKMTAVLLSCYFLLSFARMMVVDYPAALSYEKGLIQLSNRDFRDAAWSFAKTIRICRRHTPSRVHLFTTNYYNRHTLSIDTVEKYTEQYEEALTIKNLLLRDQLQASNMDTAQKLYQQQQWKKADSIFVHIIHKCPGYLAPGVMHAKCLRQQQQFKAALMACNEALTYNHQLDGALKEKDTILLNRKHL